MLAQGYTCRRCEDFTNPGHYHMYVEHRLCRDCWQSLTRNIDHWVGKYVPGRLTL